MKRRSRLATTAAHHGRPVSLWRHADFARLWSAYSVSQVGAQVTQLALPLTAILTLHSGAGQLSALTSVEYLPFVLIGLPAGVWIDRHRRRGVLIAADVVRALLLALVPLLYLLGALRLYWLYPIAFAAGACTTCFDIAHQSYLPSLVPTSQLADGNAKLQLSVSVAQVSGPGLSGLLIQLLRAPLVILANSISYLASLALLLAIRFREPPPQAPEGGHAKIRHDMADGMRLVLRSSRLRLIATCTALLNFGSGGMIFALLLLYGVRTLHLALVALGALISASSVGAIAAAAIGSRLITMLGLGRAMLLSVTAEGTLTLLVPLATPGDAAPMLAIALVGASFSGVVYNIGQVTLRQSITPQQQLGRMNAAMRSIVWGVIPLGAACAGLIAVHLGLRAAIWTGALISLAAVIPVLRAPLRTLGDLPQGGNYTIVE